VTAAASSQVKTRRRRGNAVIAASGAARSVFDPAPPLAGRRPLPFKPHPPSTRIVVGAFADGAVSAGAVVTIVDAARSVLIPRRPWLAAGLFRSSPIRLPTRNRRKRCGYPIGRKPGNEPIYLEEHGVFHYLLSR
jgi:hypothetical protein